MKAFNAIVRYALVACIGSVFILFPLLAHGAASNLPVPGLIEAGLELWTKGGGSDATLSFWQKGGLMEGSNKAAREAGYFRSLSRALGNYKSYDLIQSKGVSRTSQVIYLSINFERGVVYGRLLLYQTAKDWVVQNMDFSERPEALMPWLAFEGERATE
jgi:hypothetical protein